jgi:hypothetical protein
MVIAAGGVYRSNMPRRYGRSQPRSTEEATLNEWLERDTFLIDLSPARAVPAPSRPAGDEPDRPAPLAGKGRST